MIKKITALSSIIGYYILSATYALANHVPSHIEIQRPTVDGKNVGYSTIGDFIKQAIALAFIIAIVAVLVMLVWGAVQWIFSGGEKEAVAAARGRIINALIGLAILAVAFAIFQVAGSFLGFNIFSFTVPSPTQ